MTTNFQHTAYTTYVYSVINKETKNFNIAQRMENYFGSTKQQLEGVRVEMNRNMVIDKNTGEQVTEMTLLRNRLTNIHNNFKDKNLEGIDLYLEHPKNKTIKNYYTHANNGQRRTEKEAMEYYVQKNFEDYDYVYEEENKSKGCGGVR